MAKLPKFRYLLALLILMIVLTGCELRRSDEDVSDPGPVSDLPPTLAPLGAEADLVVEATPIPTIINVQPTATQSTLGEAQTTNGSTEPVAPTSQAVNLEPSASSAVNAEAEQASSVAPESFVPPAEEAAVEDGVIATDEAIVVDATTSEDLPIGGPVAANPPVSQTSGDYGAPTYGDTTYRVQPGDTLFSIALRYDTTVSAIVMANGLPTDMIYAGQELNIPGIDSGYTTPSYGDGGYTAPSYQQPYVPDSGQNQHFVAPGETLYRISLQYGVSVEAIAGLNSIPYPYLIQAGQQLLIPTPGAYFGPPPPPPADGYYQPPADGYYQPPADNYYQQPYQDYPPQDDAYAPVPGNANTHTVAPGETLFSISLLYGTSADILAATNGLSNPNQIYVGQVLYLP